MKRLGEYPFSTQSQAGKGWGGLEGRGRKGGGGLKALYDEKTHDTRSKQCGITKYILQCAENWRHFKTAISLLLIIYI